MIEPSLDWLYLPTQLCLLGEGRLVPPQLNTHRRARGQCRSWCRSCLFAYCFTDDRYYVRYVNLLSWFFLWRAWGVEVFEDTQHKRKPSEIRSQSSFLTLPQQMLLLRMHRSGFQKTEPGESAYRPLDDLHI